MLSAQDIPVDDSLQWELHNLRLIEIKQLNVDGKNRFDLSGLTLKGKQVFAVADKAWNNYIYEINQPAQSDGSWELVNTTTLGLVEIIDLEGLDYCDSTFYFINEANSQVYALKMDGQMSYVPVHYYLVHEDPKNWKTNAGLEGIAVNCTDNTMYLAKERDPRKIYVVDMIYGKITDQFNISEKESMDFSDMKYEKGYLYVLERHGNYVAKIELVSKKVVAKASYREIASAPEGKLYEPSQFGMAEALVITENEIWIGIDNNGINVSSSAKEKYGLSGNQPSILKFERPEGF